jgi:RHS repeat-associated protein
MERKLGLWMAVVLVGVAEFSSLALAAELPCGNKMRLTGNAKATPAAVPRVVLLSKSEISKILGDAAKVQPRPRVDYGDPVIPYTGNEFKEIQDLQIWGAVGDEAMSWTRYANSRAVSGTNLFGMGHYWRHGYQWELTEFGRDSQLRTQMRLVYPDGTNAVFTALEGGVWGSNGTLTDRLVKRGDDFILLRQSGSEFRFSKTKVGTAELFQLRNFLDASGNTFSVEYSRGREISKVIEPAGRFFSVNYQTVVGNQPNIQLLGVATRPFESGQWMEFEINEPKPFRFARIVQADGSFGKIAGVEFYEAVTGARLTGTPISSDQDTAALAFDDDVTTAFQSASESGGFVGYDFGKARTIGRVRVLSEAGMESVHFGTAFRERSLQVEGMNERPVSMRVICSVRTSDGRSVEYRYTPFADPTLPWTFPVLSSVEYGDGTQATYGYSQVVPTTRPLVADWADVRYGLRQNRYRTVYQTRFTGAVIGMVQSQINIETGGEILRIGLNAGASHEPTVTFANGAVCRQFMSEAADGRAAVQTETDALGRRTFFTFGEDGYLSSTRDPLGRVTRFLWSPAGNLRSITRADGSSESWERNEREAIVRHVDALGRVTLFERDQLNRISRVVYPDASFEEFEYNGFGQVVSHRDKLGNLETREYDSRGLMIKSCDAANQCTRFGYDSADRLRSMTDPLGRVTRMEYNERGLLVKTMNPDGSSRLMTYSSEGDLVSEQDELGFVWSYKYDIFRRVISMSDPLGNEVQKRYHPDCTEVQPLEVKSAGNVSFRLEYDLGWKLVASTMSPGTSQEAVTRFGYDKGDRLISVTDPLGHALINSYDLMDRKVKVQDASGVSSISKYDEAGNLSWIQTNGGARTSFEYDSMNRLVCTTNPNGHAVRFEYDRSGKRIAMVDARNFKYVWAYDAVGRLSSAGYPDGSLERWSYDMAGNPVQFVNRAGQSRLATFDPRNREVAVRWSDQTAALTRNFDLLGRPVAEENGLCSIQSEYDALGNLIHEKVQPNGGPSRDVYYSRDAEGRVLSLRYPSGSVTERRYGGTGNLERVLQNGVPVAEFSYDGGGRVLGVTYANGSTVSLRRDALGRVLNVDHWFGVDQSLSVGYQFDRTGARAVRSQSGFVGLEQAYRYDKDGQLVSVRDGDQNPLLYAYDPSGNRLTEEMAWGTRVYSSNALNQFTTVGGASFSYDANANLRQSDAGIYEYDAESRLTRAEVGGHVVLFAYDPRGRCFRKTVDGEVREFTFAGWSVLEEWRNGHVDSAFVYGAGEDELLGFTNALGQFFIHADSIGSTVAVSDWNAKPVEYYRYSAFGRPEIVREDGVVDKRSAVGNSRLFAGGEWIAEAAVYDLRNRVYSPHLGRFHQPDPMQFDGGDANLYRYVGNNPVNRVDPLGLYAVVRDDCGEVSVTIPLMFLGPGASPAVVQKFTQGIERYWSGEFGRYQVRTRVTVADKSTPRNLKNVIYVPEGNERAFVYTEGRNTGEWSSQRPGWTAAHEAGHLMGLPDRYTDKVGPHPGYETNIMGVHGGTATAADIAAIIKLNP